MAGDEMKTPTGGSGNEAYAHEPEAAVPRLPADDAEVGAGNQVTDDEAAPPERPAASSSSASAPRRAASRR